MADRAAAANVDASKYNFVKIQCHFHPFQIVSFLFLGGGLCSASKTPKVTHHWTGDTHLIESLAPIGGLELLQPGSTGSDESDWLLLNLMEREFIESPTEFCCVS